MDKIAVIDVADTKVKALVSSRDGIYSSDSLNEPVVYLFQSDIEIVTGEKAPEVACLGNINYLAYDESGAVKSVVFKDAYKVISVDKAKEKIMFAPLTKEEIQRALVELMIGVENLKQEYRDRSYYG